MDGKGKVVWLKTGEGGVGLWKEMSGKVKVREKAIGVGKGEGYGVRMVRGGGKGAGRMDKVVGVGGRGDCIYLRVQ